MGIRRQDEANGDPQPSWDILNQLLAAVSLEARLGVIQAHPDLLADSVDADLDAATQQLWETGQFTDAEEYWRVKSLLDRVRQDGIDSAYRALTTPIELVTDDNLLLDRSKMPLRTPRAIYDLLKAIETQEPEQVLATLASFADALVQPIAPILCRKVARAAQKEGMGSPARLELVARLLETFAAGQDVTSLIHELCLDKDEILDTFTGSQRVALQYAGAETWEEAHHLLRLNQAVLCSEEVHRFLAELHRGMWQSGETEAARLTWRRLRVLQRSQIAGIEEAFSSYVWQPEAELVWQSPEEIGMMEAARIPIPEMGPLFIVVVPLRKGNQAQVSELVNRNRDFFRQPWAANYMRFMAEEDRAAKSGFAEIYESVASWFDQLRD